MKTKFETYQLAAERTRRSSKTSHRAFTAEVASPSFEVEVAHNPPRSLGSYGFASTVLDGAPGSLQFEHFPSPHPNPPPRERVSAVEGSLHRDSTNSRPQTVLPLTKGEGWGENARNQFAHCTHEPTETGSDAEGYPLLGERARVRGTEILDSLEAHPKRPAALHSPTVHGEGEPQVLTPSAFNAAGAAFSLIEIMVAMVLLSFIVIGLLAMFHQVQKAFRSSMTQVDVLESGRSITDLIARDIEQMIASSFATNVNIPQTVNFSAVVSSNFSASLHQPLPGNNSPRTNVIQRVFLLSKANQDWIGTGYEVQPQYVNAGVGTLYRYTTNVSKPRAYQLYKMFNNELPPVGIPPTNRNLSRIADGVVDFRVRVFDTNGVEITVTNTTPDEHLAFQATVNGARRLVTIPNGYGSWDAVNGQYNYFFVSNAIPAAVELEIAFLESHLLDRYRAMSAGLIPPIPTAIQDAQRSFLSNHVANVHVFRQRIPIHNVNPSAYQ